MKALLLKLASKKPDIAITLSLLCLSGVALPIPVVAGAAIIGVAAIFAA